MEKRPFFAQRQLGFRRNPFSALTEQEWGATAFAPPACAFSPRQSKQNLQLIGQVGSGKSSLLLYYVGLLREEGVSVVYEYIPQGQRRFLSALDEVDIFVLDEAQRLNRWHLRRWMGWLCEKPSRRTLFGTHRNLAGWFEKRGLLLSTFDVAAAVSVETYACWLERRLRYFALDGEPVVRFTADAVQLLYMWFGADMRAAEYFLYDVLQGMGRPGTVTAVSLHEARQHYQPKTRSPRHD